MKQICSVTNTAWLKFNITLVLKGFRSMGFIAEGGNEVLLERTVKAYFGKLLKIRDRTPAALLKQRPEQLEKQLPH